MGGLCCHLVLDRGGGEKGAVALDEDVREGGGQGAVRGARLAATAVVKGLAG